MCYNIVTMKKLINYTYKFRLSPTKEQEKVLFQDFGNARFVYNEILKQYQKDHLENKASWNAYKYIKKLPTLKKDFPFLKTTNAQVLQQEIKHLDTAFKNYFAHRAEAPVLKHRKDDKGIAIPQFFEIKGNRLFLPKLKTPIKIELHREIIGKMKSITITKASFDKFFVSVLVEKEIKKLPKVDKLVGIDVGLKTFAVMATTSLSEARTKPLSELNFVHTKIENPKYLLKAEKHLKRLQKALSKKQHKRSKKDETKASKNYIKACKKLANPHGHVASQRKDFLQKATSTLIHENQVLGLEDLNIAGMKKNHHLAKAISDVGWGYFKTFLKYKASWYGRRIVEANRWFASSKTCSTPACTYVKKDLKLSERAWTCPVCGKLHDRDENGATEVAYIALAAVKTVPPERRERGRKTKTPVETRTSGLVAEKLQEQVLSGSRKPQGLLYQRKLQVEAPHFNGE